MRALRLVVVTGMAVSVLASCSGSTIRRDAHLSSTSTTAPVHMASADERAAAHLDLVGVLPEDLATGGEAVLMGAGNEVSGRVSLDLCNADYPSEDRRVARHQVNADFPEVGSVLSTEALLYASASGAAQAFTELMHAHDTCPQKLRRSDVWDAPPSMTSFGPTPELGARVAGVDRLAYLAEVSDKDGAFGEYVAVYQRRGRMLVALYVYDPMGLEAEVSTDVGGLSGLTQRIAERMAAVPPAAIDDPGV